MDQFGQNLINAGGINIMPTILELPFTAGNIYHVKPYSGSDSNYGDNQGSAFKTLAQAQKAVTANQNDVVLMYAESNTAASTTDYQTGNLAWAKDGVHLIGINANPFFSPRSRVAFTSTFNSAANLFTLSANGCLIKGIEMFMGVAGTSPTGCLSITGMRNKLSHCHIAGFGGAAGANDIASAYSLLLAGAQENIIEDTVIGVDTVTLGASVNAQIYATTASPRNKFSRCQIVTYTNHATNNQFLRVGANGIDRFLEFEDCLFRNPTGAGSTALTSCFTVAAGAGGDVLLTGKTANWGGGYWNATNAGNVIVQQASGATTTGIMLATTH